MTPGLNYHLIDYAGLVPAVTGKELNSLKADNDEFAQADFDLKARKIMDAGIRTSDIIPAKAGALLIRAESSEAFKAWGAIFGGASFEATAKFTPVQKATVTKVDYSSSELRGMLAGNFASAAQGVVRTGINLGSNFAAATGFDNIVRPEFSRPAFERTLEMAA